MRRRTVPAMNDLSRLVTLPVLLERCPWLTERWVRSLVHADTIPHYKPAGRLLFDLDEVEAWARQRSERA